MKRNMIEFDIVEYANGKFMMTRSELIDPPVEGLPPTYNSTICFTADDFKRMIIALEHIYYDYGKTK